MHCNSSIIHVSANAIYATFVLFTDSTSFFHSFCFSLVFFHKLIRVDFAFSFAGIIKCVTLTTLYMNSMWWPPNRSIGGTINQAIFLILSALSSFNYVMATVVGPGFLALRWQPKVSKKQSHRIQLF